MTLDLRLRLPLPNNTSTGRTLARVGLALVLLAGCDAVVGDPQPAATETSPGSTGTSGTGSSTTDPDPETPPGGTKGTTGDPGPTEPTPEPEPESSSDGSTSGGDPQTESSTGSPSYPACLEPFLEPYHDALGPACEGFLIVEYDFEDQQVFVFDSSQCGFFDQFFPVFNGNCELLCNLYGLAGITECEGVEFYDNATELESWPYPE